MMAEELSLFDVASAKLSDAQKLTGEAHELLKEDLEKVRREKAAFEEMTKTLNEVHFASTIKLNVGGKIYKTTLSTVRKDPDSMLCAMFSGRHELKQDEDDGAYFIDRDGELFRYILNYLRNGELFCPNDKMFKQELLSEAKFYQVQGLVAHLEGNSLASSIILKKQLHRIALMSWLPPGASCSLLFRASVDGQTPQDFHRCCDNRGPTLLVIQSGEYISGGYTSESWRSPDSNGDTENVEDKQSFLFTLCNPFGTEPVKISPKPGTSGGIRYRSDFGPRFGSKYSNDLTVWTSDNYGVGQLKLGNGFTCPEDADQNTFFTGRNTFRISELEVFKICLL